MRTVYNLIMVDEALSYDNYTERFNIGFFSAREKAENTARKYLTEVTGFKDYNVTYQIVEKQVIGWQDSLQLTDIFIIYGWNENEESDEIDVVESECFTNEPEAENELKKLKANYHRREWCISKYSIDTCNWEDGFVRNHH